MLRATPIGSPTVILPPLARRCPEIDLEELRRGRRRDKHGGWRGKDPKIVPKAIHDEWVSRQFEQVHQELADAVLPAVKRLGAIATADFVDHDIQLKAIEMILVRVFGKPDTSLGKSAATNTEGQANNNVHGGVIEMKPQGQTPEFHLRRRLVSQRAERLPGAPLLTWGDRTA